MRPELAAVLAALTETEDAAQWQTRDVFCFDSNGTLFYSSRASSGLDCARWRVRTPQEALENLSATARWPFPLHGEEAPAWGCERCVEDLPRRAVFRWACEPCASASWVKVPRDLYSVLRVAALGPARLRSIHARIREESGVAPFWATGDVRHGGTLQYCWADGVVVKSYPDMNSWSVIVNGSLT